MFKQRRRSTQWARWAVLAAIGAGLSVTGCSSSESSSSNPDGGESPETTPYSRIVNVKVKPVTSADFADSIRIVGEVEAWQDVTVGVEENGVIKRIFVERGAPVQKGQAVAKLKDEVLTAQVEEARATAELAREQYERQRELWEKDKVGSELAYLEARSRANAAGARLNMLKARLDNTTVRAPISGTLDDRYLEVGEMATIGSPLVRIVKMDRVKISGGVPERFALSVHAGDSALITFDVLPRERFKGKISYAGSAVDPDSRTFPVEVVLENPHREIKPSMVANLRLVREHLSDVIIVPREVVQRREKGHIVYIAQENEGTTLAVARSITLGPAHGNQVVVNSGLEVGELLITLGHQQVDDGSPVRLVKNPDRESDRDSD